jgi:hypothetical protein
VGETEGGVRTRTVAVAALGVALLLVPSGTVYEYHSSRADTDTLCAKNDVLGTILPSAGCTDGGPVVVGPAGPLQPGAWVAVLGLVLAPRIHPGLRRRLLILIFTVALGLSLATSVEKGILHLWYGVQAGEFAVEWDYHIDSILIAFCAILARGIAKADRQAAS